MVYVIVTGKGFFKYYIIDMNILDKHYLSLQFSNKLFKKSGTEFQTFFENIMEKAFSDFQKIKPSGNKGDGGNDGYRRGLGIYYQVYAPNEPKINESKASKKLKEDFEKLQTRGWNEISNIKEYHFVFNDKYSGSTQELEKAISELKQSNPSAEFKLFLAKDLEDVFFALSESDILNLGFNIDKRQALTNAYLYLDNIKIELDRENAVYAQKILENIKEIISELSDESLSLEYEILECRCLQKLEKIDEAKTKYKSLTKRYPEDPRAFLYLAEIYLNDENFDKNLELLQKAEKLDDDFWLLKLEQLVRKSHLGEKINLKNVDENEFSDDYKIKSNFYRLYALFFEDENNKTKADSFIEKAIHANPERFSNYLAKLSILEKRLFLEQQELERQGQAEKLLEEIKKVEDKFFKYRNIGARNKAILNIKKLNTLRLLENFPEFEKISKETFELSISCYLDKQIEQIIAIVLQLVSLPDNDFNKLLKYIKDSKKEISDELSKVLIFQFNIREKLLTDGKKFFIEIKNQKYIDFIENLENKEYKEVLLFLESDISFAVTIANTLKNFPELRRKIIESLPNDENISKEKLLLLLSFDEKDFDEAFNILKKLDLSKLSYLECKPILQIVQQKKAWDFEVIILQKLISKEKDKKQKFDLELQLFNAYFNLKKYSEVNKIGKELLEFNSIENLLNNENKEDLLASTILACLERGKIEDRYYMEAKEILKKYQLSEPSFEFKAGIEAEVYLHNNEPQNALKAVIEGVAIRKILSPAEYGRLFFWFIGRMNNKIDYSLESKQSVDEGSFVKLKGDDKWYFVGEGNSLDANHILKDSKKYKDFIGKKKGGEIIFESPYSIATEKYIIEGILSMQNYILWQSRKYFNELAHKGLIDEVQVISVPEKGESVDLRYVQKFMKDMRQKSELFFNMYLKNNMPLAILALSEGGIINAIGRIQSEQKGFINFSDGTIKEFEKQKEVARNIIQKKMPFYIDGTSALFLSEIGYLEKIYKHISNIKVPQSVINMLGELSEKFTYMPGQVGHMGYAQGKINYSSIDKEKRGLIRNNIINSAKILESNPNNIEVISSANKIDCFSEQKVSPELSDACILAQKEKIPVLTEDFLYLKMNELETKKKAPEYFSSLALLRVLYENKGISFEEYLEYFGYLSSYRFRFLSLNSNDIEIAIFGNNDIKTFKPENIRKFNFPLTLSEEYGVSFELALRTIVEFMIRVITNDSVTTEMAKKIFIEILGTFPTNKKEFGQLILKICIAIINKNQLKSTLALNSEIIDDKIQRLLQVSEL